MEEMSGDLANLVLPLDVEAWTMVMLKAIEGDEHDDPLQRERRILQAVRFQWKDGAAKVLNAYENLIG
jgi:hypothetical protein